MSKSAQSEKFTFSIKGIEILDFNLIYPPPDIKDIKTFNFNINAEQKISIENNILLNLITVDILNEDNVTKLGSIKVNLIFEIANFEEFIDEKTKNLILPGEVLLVMNSLSISTTRGVMFSQFKGTHLHNAILPVIDPKQMTNQLNKTK